MKITFLGTASGMPVIDRASSSLVVGSAGQHIILDTGEGITRRILESGIDLESISDIVISHTHPDHIAGLTIFMQLLYLKGRKAPLDIFIPKFAIETIKRLFDISFIWQNRWQFDFNIKQLDAGEAINTGRFSILPQQTSHLCGYRCDLGLYNLDNPEAFSLMITADDANLVYSADIGKLDDLECHLDSRHINALILEGMHYEMSNLPTFIDKYDIETVYITHLPIEPDNFTIPDGPFKIAHDLESFEV